MKYAITRVNDSNGNEVVLTVLLDQGLADRVGRYVAGVRRVNCPEFLKASFWEGVDCFEARDPDNTDSFDEVSDEQFVVVDTFDDKWTPCRTETELLHVKPDGLCYWTLNQRHSSYQMETANIDLLAVLAEQGIKPTSEDD